MRRRGAFIALMVATLVGASATPAGAAAPAYRYHFLSPGGQPRLTETVPVNVVFLGYEPGQVGQRAFTGQLARTYEPVVRSRLNYDVVEKLGITYKYDYRLKYTDRAYEDRFFKQLSRLAEPAPLRDALDHLRAGFSREELTVDVSQHVPWSNRIHADLVARELERELFRQLN